MENLGENTTLNQIMDTHAKFILSLSLSFTIHTAVKLPNMEHKDQILTSHKSGLKWMVLHFPIKEKVKYP